MNTVLFRPTGKAAFPPFVQWSQDNAMLSRVECEWVIQHADRADLSFASVGTPTEYRTELETRCVQSEILEAGDYDWLYERIAKKVQLANEAYYTFDLLGLIEPIQFLKYTPGNDDKPDGHYKWHVDFGEGAMGTRKLSMIVQLSDPASYEGCRLTLNGERGPDEIPILGCGDAFMFPSWSPHTVSPITRGTRYALVCWVHGPRFR